MLHRSHTGVEDRVRTSGDGTGQPALYLLGMNRGWMLGVNLAHDLDAWVRLLAVHDDEDLADAEPNHTFRPYGRSDDGDPWLRACETQLCSVPGWIPRSSTTPGIGFPVSVMIRSAPSWNSAS